MGRLIGGHVSAAGGVDKAIERGAEIGGNCLQLFAGSPRSWRRLDLETVNFDKVFAKMKEISIVQVFTHSLYLVNFASEKPDLLQKSLNAVSQDLRFDAAVNGGGVVVHLGSHLGAGWDAVRHQVLDSIDQVLSQTPAESTLLIENSAGQKGKLCSDLEEIKWLLDELEKRNSYVSNNRVGWCYDTCHGWAAGYWMGTDASLQTFQDEHQPDLFASTEEQPKNLYSEIDRLDLWPTLLLVHLNDSKDLFASGRDRHENIGDGTIYQVLLEYFVNYAEIIRVPIITEVPGIAGDGPDAENITRIKQLLHQK